MTETVLEKVGTNCYRVPHKVPIKVYANEELRTLLLKEIEKKETSDACFTPSVFYFYFSICYFSFLFFSFLFFSFLFLSFLLFLFVLL